MSSPPVPCSSSLSCNSWHSAIYMLLSHAPGTSDSFDSSPQRAGSPIHTTKKLLTLQGLSECFTIFIFNRTVHPQKYPVHYRQRYEHLIHPILLKFQLKLPHTHSLRRSQVGHAETNHNNHHHYQQPIHDK